ncbi:MAG: P1 family peptidase [Candidatus Promineifilaceae bacterium]|jgi:D-aminopeptidase
MMKDKRSRDFGIAPGIYKPGKLNAITDVPGVRVGQVTLVEGENIRTGVTAVLPHAGNVYQDRVPAGLAVGNGYGKLSGISQLQELGELETPVVLTNTLSVPEAAAALIIWTLKQKGNEAVRSVNPVAGETNDGYLNDIRRRFVTEEHVLQALANARKGAVEEGAVGAGTGTVCFGWKGGIGTSSRRLPGDMGGYHLGVLVQTNYGGQLQIMGRPMVELSPQTAPNSGDGSIMILVATDAPLSDRNLRRLAWRSFTGLARTGSSFANGSGDYAIAFSTATAVRRKAAQRHMIERSLELGNENLSPLFQAVIEATEEAIYNSLWAAATTTGYHGRTIYALPQEEVLARLKK